MSFGGDIMGLDWAHSVGLYLNYHHPELVVVGLDVVLAGAVIELLCIDIQNGRKLSSGDQLSMDGGMVFHVGGVDDDCCREGDWFALGREVVDGLGAVWPDTLQLVGKRLWRLSNGLGRSVVALPAATPCFERTVTQGS